MIDDGSAEMEPTDVYREVITALLHNRDFLGLQMSHRSGLITETEFSDLSER